MIKGILLHHNFIKISSCLIGYTLWIFLAQYQTITISQQVPVCFYQVTSNFTITAPDFVNVSFSGKRKHVYLWNQQNTVIHLDASSYTEGKHFIQLTRENVFLPDHIKLESLTPNYIEIIFNKKE